MISTEENDARRDDAAEQLVTGPPPVSAYRGLLRNRNFRLWFVSGLGSSLGDWAGLFALQVLVATLAKDDSRLALFSLGGIMMARLLPSVLFGPVAGVLADRYDRKRLMVTTDLLRGLLFVAIAFSRDLVALFALTFIVECLSLLYMSAKDASLPVIVKRRLLPQANQLNLLVTYGPLPFGAAAASAMALLAALLNTTGLVTIESGEQVVLALLLNAATFFFAGLVIARVRLPAHGRKATEDRETGLFDEVVEGVRFIRDLPLIRSLIVGAVGVSFGAGVVVTLGPEFVGTALGEPREQWLTLMTFVGSGLLVGIVLAPVLSTRFSKERLFPVVLAATAAIAAVTALAPTLGLTFVGGALLGATAGMSFVLAYTLLHEYTDDATRARTFAAFYTTTRVAIFTALALTPFVAAAVGRPILGIGGRVVTMDGIRFTMLLGALFALASAVSAGRAMYRSLREPPRPSATASLSLPGDEGAGHDNGGCFVVLEGVEGSGKSTQVRLLAEALENEGYRTVLTREPGGPPVAERIRTALLEEDGTPMLPRTEALLHAAARAEHAERVIVPALAEGNVVISDRFVDSSLAYQGVARGLGEESVLELNRWALGGLTPDVVVLLDLDPADGLERVHTRADTSASGDAEAPGEEHEGLDRMEREDLAFHQRVAEGYRMLARRAGDRFVVVEAAADQETVARRVRAAVRPWLPLPEAPATVALERPELERLDDERPGEGREEDGGREAR